MRDEVLKIINNPKIKEPIDKINFLYRKLTTESAKNEFNIALRSIAMFGTDREKFITLYFISYIKKVTEYEEVIKFNVGNIDIRGDESLIGELLSLCSEIAKDWCIEFINRVMNAYKSEKNVYLYTQAISCITRTPYWSQYINEINYTLLNSKESWYFIHFFAYFKWTKSETEWKKLLTIIDKRIKESFVELEPFIEKRYQSFAEFI